jgi:hypothetical protein
MFANPPLTFTNRVHKLIHDLLSERPEAASNEDYLKHHVEFELLHSDVDESYALRIGINYRGGNVQRIETDDSGTLIGWNPDGSPLGIEDDAMVLLSGHTIIDRGEDEPDMNDSKISGGNIPDGKSVRIEFKVRGWLGKTKNLDGAQVEKDLNLLKNDDADLLIMCLSETAHRKWLGEGPEHHARRRIGVDRFQNFLFDIDDSDLPDGVVKRRNINFESQHWRVSCQRVEATQDSIMPGANHFITMCWKVSDDPSHVIRNSDNRAIVERQGNLFEEKRLVSRSGSKFPNLPDGVVQNVLSS